MKTLSRYLYRQTFNGLILAFIIIVSLIVVVDFVGLSRRFGALENVNSFTILHLTFMKMPSVLEDILPFIILFGVMWSMSQLNRRSELVAMRAAGYSAWHFIIPPTVLSAFVGILATTLANPAAAFLDKQYEADLLTISRNAAHGKSVIGNRVWMREVMPDGSTLVIRARNADVEKAELMDTTFIYYRYSENSSPQFERRFDAEKAILTPKKWHLTDVLKHTNQSALAQVQTNLELPSTLIPGDLVERLAKPDSFSFWSLPHVISSARQAGLESLRYELKWQNLLALPLTLAAMAMIGATFSFRLVRLGGTFRMIVFGTAIGFALYFAGDMLQALGATRILPSVVAVWAPPAFVFLAGLIRVTILEDG